MKPHKPAVPNTPLSGRSSSIGKRLIVQCVKGENIKTGKSLFGKADPYAVFVCGKTEHKTTVNAGGGCDPVWDEQFVFEITDETEMTIVVYDKETTGNDRFMAQCTVNIIDWINNGSFDGSLELVDKNLRPEGIIIVSAKSDNLDTKLPPMIKLPPMTAPDTGRKSGGGTGRKHSKSTIVLEDIVEGGLNEEERPTTKQSMKSDFDDLGDEEGDQKSKRPTTKQSMRSDFDDLGDEEGDQKSKKKKKDKKKANAMEEAKRIAKEKADAMEQKRLARELTKITIVAVEIKELISAHKFAKNDPWILCVVNGDQKFRGEYQEAPYGDHAEWHDLNWKFLRPRNQEDRKDMVIAVGSKDLIIGRYVLTAEEWGNIPNTETGYFEIAGDIYNYMGLAGKISVTCHREAEKRPPKAPPPSHEDIVAPPHTVYPANFKAWVRIVSLSAIELPPGHIGEFNSPYAVITCGDNFEKRTSVLVYAGSSCQWDRLPWRLIMHRDPIMTISFWSLKVLLGQVCITLGEIGVIPPDEHGNTVVVRKLLDGAKISGQVRMVLFLSATPINDGGDYVDSLKPAFHDLKIKQIIESQSIIEVPKIIHNPPLNIKSGYSLYLPFKVTVIALAVIDTEQISFPIPNSLSGNIACGAYGGGTAVVHNSGGSAQWMGLKWPMIIENELSKIRITIWSRGKVVGTNILKPEQLLDFPHDNRGITDLTLKIFSENGKVSGKIKISCVYEQYYDQNELKLLKSIDDVNPYLIQPHHLDLPLMMQMKEMSAFDLRKVHKISKNSPRIRVCCDRRSAYTNSKLWAGTVASWHNLEWPIPVNEGSELKVIVYSEDVEIGQFDLNSSELTILEEKVTKEKDKDKIHKIGKYEITKIIKYQGFKTGKVRIRFDLIPIDPEEFRINYPVGEEGLIKNSESVPTFGKQKAVNIETKKDNNSIIYHPQVLQTSKSWQARSHLGFSLKVLILEIDVSELKRAHSFSKNSPQLLCLCGKLEKSTEINLNAGPETFWTGLNWEVMIKDDNNIRFRVQSQNVVIGEAYITPDNIVEAKPDPNGVKRISASLFNSPDESQVTGRVKIAYVLEAVKDVPKNSTIAKPIFEEEIPLNFPLLATVSKIVSYDLQEIHSIGRIVPYARITCDDFDESTNKKWIVRDDTASWHDINWEIRIINTSVFTVYIMSGSDPIGHTKISGMDIINWPQKDGDIELQRIIYDESNMPSGRVQVFMNIKAVGRPKFVIDPNKKIQVTGTSNKPERVKALNANTTFKITLQQLSISNVEDAGTLLDKQDPAIILIICNASFQTKRVQEGGTKCTFPEIFDNISATYGDDILVQVHNMDANGVSKKLLGTGQIKISEAIARQHELASDSILILLNNSAGKSRGKVTMKAIFERVDDEEDNNSEDSNITEGEIYNVNPLKNAAMLNKRDEEELTLPAFVDISSITVVDLKSVHVITSNKNVAHMAYGEQAFFTDVVNGKNVGKAAEWLSLHWTVELVGNSIVTFTIKSMNIEVGTCELKADYLLSPKRNKIGLQKIIYPLRYKGKMKGKIKIMYKLYRDMQELDPSLQEAGSGSGPVHRRGGVLDLMSSTSLTSQEMNDLRSLP